MSSKYGTFALWLLTLLLFLAFLWSLNLTAFNYWASGGPPTPHPEIYRMRGNIFFGIACVLFVALAVCLWRLFQRNYLWSLFRRTRRPVRGAPGNWCPYRDRQLIRNVRN